ncbi:MAG: hypothetical protein R3E83_23920 [Burkholderiaceae bacterium]
MSMFGLSKPGIGMPWSARSARKADPWGLAALFEGDDSLYKACVAQARSYVEYGVGSSTVWAATRADCAIHSVDTDGAWISKVMESVGPRPDLTIKHADLGPVGEWGRPLDYRFIDHFALYTDWPWRATDADVDLVLIDGRFRVCCFLTALLYARPGTKILFDDYMNRPNYHIVENFVRREDNCGRQALFVVPGKMALDLHEIGVYIERFRLVMD